MCIVATSLADAGNVLVRFSRSAGAGELGKDGPFIVQVAKIDLACGGREAGGTARARALLTVALLAVATVTLGAQPAEAQVAPPTRDTLVPQSAPAQERSSLTFSVDGQMERGACALDSPDLANVRLTLSQVSFAGAEAANDVDLSASYVPYLGRELPLSVLCDIRAAATQLLSDAGYLAAVEIPEQRLEGGAATLRVVLGRLTALRVRGEAGPSERVLAAYLQHLVGQPVFNVRQAERYLLLADDIPGLDVRLALRAAATGAPGDLIGEVGVVRRQAAVDLSLQNYGASELGRFGGLLRAEFYDLTGMGDRTTISAYSSHDFSEQQSLQVAHDVLVGSEGLALGGQVTAGWTHPTLNLPGFDVKSDTLFAGIHASYPFQRTQAGSIHGSAGLDLVDQDVKANGLWLSRDNVRTAWARVDLVWTDRASLARRGGYSPFEPRTRAAFGLELRQMLGILGANRDCRVAPAVCAAANELPSRVEQDPTSALLRAEFHGEYRPTPLITVALDLTGQFTRDPLPAFEELSGGNFSAGRGYDPAAITGDSGLTGRFELRYGSMMPTSADGFALQPYVFADGATVRDRDPSQRTFNPDSLYSIGGGLRITYAPGMQGDVTLAVPLKRTDQQVLANQPNGDVRLLVSLTSRLLPWRF